MSDAWGVIIAAAIAAIGSLVTFYFTRRKQQADYSATIAAAAGDLVEKYRQEVKAQAEEIKELKTRVDELEESQEVMQKKYGELRDGAKRLHGQVISMGGVPVYHPPQ